MASDLTWRTFANKSGKTYNASETTRPYAQDMNLLGAALVTGQSRVLITKKNVTTAERDSIPNPSAGMEVFNTDTGLPEFYNGTTWVSISAGSGWTRTVYRGSDFTGTNGQSGRRLVHTGTISSNNQLVIGKTTQTPTEEYTLDTTNTTNDTAVMVGPIFDDDTVILWTA